MLAGLFFVLPALVGDGVHTGWLMVPLLLMLFPAASFLLCAFDAWRFGFSWLLPLFVGALFLSTVYIYYNSTARV